MEYRFLPGLQSTYTKEIRAHVLHHSKCNYSRSRRSKKKPSKKRVDDEAEVGQPSRSLVWILLNNAFREHEEC